MSTEEAKDGGVGAQLEAAASADRLAAQDLRALADALGWNKRAEKRWLGRIADRLDANATMLTTFIGDDRSDTEDVREASRFNRRAILKAATYFAVGISAFGNDVTDLVIKARKGLESADEQSNSLDDVVNGRIVAQAGPATAAISGTVTPPTVEARARAATVTPSGGVSTSHSETAELRSEPVDNTDN